MIKGITVSKRMMQLRHFLLVSVVAAGVSSHLLAASSADQLARAASLYNSTDYHGALNALVPMQSRTAAANLLIGKSYYMLGDFKKATDAFHQAASMDPGNSEYHHWLGRAYGRRAESGNPLTAPGHASKARQNFEKAVQLDPKNSEALNDLFDYYLQAPGFLGGGLDKAQALLPKIKAIDSAEFSFAQAQIAEKRKEFTTAEQQLRRAVELAPRQVGRVLDLAKFLLRQGRVPEGDALMSHAAKIAPNDPKVLFEQASVYVQSKRNLGEARKLLKAYMQAPLTPDMPSRADAQKLLKQAEGGD